MLNNILAGPILRRTTQDRVCVWLALDNSQRDLKLEILDKDEQVLGESKLDELAASQFPLGQNLFIYLLKAYPTGNANFKTGVPLYYRLSNSADGTVDLRDANLTYGDHKHPIFHIPDRLQSVLHGSCRKPHGDEGTDSLTAGDALLEKFYTGQADGRPDMLLLTGDQIYADDVAASLLATLKREAIALIGKEGVLPLQEAGIWPVTSKNRRKFELRMRIKQLRKGLMKLLGRRQTETPIGPELNPAGIDLGGRKEILRDCNSGFTSGEADNHLMAFGEYAAMYIYVFGNARNWSTPDWDEIKDSHVQVKDKKKLAEILESIKAVDEFGKTLPKIRRLLANIPTYMIFDDHDVTDDWNITGHWYDQVRSSPLGRRIISNALAAYWAFQAWGNDPDNFDNGMIESIIRHLNKSGSDPDGDRSYDLLTWKHRGWGFSIPTDPPIIAMDSRTQRQPDNPLYPARLMDRYALDWLREEWTKLKTGKNNGLVTSHSIGTSTCPVLIAATPVMGFSPLENLVQFFLWVVGTLEYIPIIRFLEGLADASGYATGKLVEMLDAESWSANLSGFTDLLDTLLHKMDLEKCVFLSGDVHYSFTAAGWYKSSAGYTGMERTLDCRQLTSSALRNDPSATQEKALKELENLKRGEPSRKSNWWRFYAAQWKMEYSLRESTGGGQSVIPRCNLGQVVFEAGFPERHILWQGTNNSLVYDVPPFDQPVQIQDSASSHSR